MSGIFIFYEFINYVCTWPFQEEDETQGVDSSDKVVEDEDRQMAQAEVIRLAASGVLVSSLVHTLASAATFLG